MLSSIVEIIKLAREGIEAIQKNATLAQCNTDVQAKFEETCAEVCKMYRDLEAARGQVITLKRQLADVGAGLEKLASKAAQTKIDF